MSQISVEPCLIRVEGATRRTIDKGLTAKPKIAEQVECLTDGRYAAYSLLRSLIPLDLHTKQKPSATRNRVHAAGHIF